MKNGEWRRGEQYRVEPDDLSARIFHRNPRPSDLRLGATHVVRREIEIVFESDWEYIHAKIDFAFTEARPGVKRCE